jgi:hypothetical protein
MSLFPIHSVTSCLGFTGVLQEIYQCAIANYQVQSKAAYPAIQVALMASCST